VPGRFRLGLFAAFVGLGLSTRALFLAVPFLDLDEAAHLVGSWVWLGGGRLYTDFVDNKPPLLYLYYAFAQQLLGRGLPAVRLFTAGLTLPLTAYAASAFFRHDRRGALAGFTYLVYGASFLAHDMLAVNTEVLLLLPATAAIALFRDEARSAARCAAAGALLGVASLLKPQACLWLLALVPGLGRAGLAALAAGFALPLFVVWASFALTGGASDLLYWTVEWNLAYAANPILPSEALLRAARSLLPFLAATAPLWWASWRGLRLLPATSRRLLAGLILSSLPAAFLGFRFFPHYFVQLYVPLSLAAAPAFDPLLRRPLSRIGRGLLAFTALLLGAFTAVNAWLYLGPAEVYTETRPVFQKVADRLRVDPCFARGTLFVWGYAPMFYVTSGLPPASRFVVPQASLSGYVAGNTASQRGELDTRAFINPRHRALLLADLERKPPSFILDTTAAGLYHWERRGLETFPELAGYVAQGYESIDVVDGVNLLRRRACARQGAP